MATIDSSAWRGSARQSDADSALASDARRSAQLGLEADELGFDEPKWPAWKVTVAVVLFCGAFWMGVGYLAMRLLG